LNKDLKITTTGLTIPFTGLKKQYNNLRKEILDATDEVLRSGILMSGNNTAEFESWLARKNNLGYAVTCHSGTQALEIIAGYYAGDINIRPPRVLVPAMTFPATANAFLRTGWTVELVDVDAYGQMDLRKIDKKNMSIQAICAVGLYGQSVKDQYFYYTDTIIEDGAQHWLASNCHRLSNSCAISFDPTKNLANYGNGGAVVTRDAQLATYARDWVNNGKHLGHMDPGTNSRMSEVDCAQMMVKTHYIDSWQKRRGEIAAHWIERLKQRNVRSLIDDSNFKDHSYHKFVIEVDARDEVQKQMSLRKIETKVHYADPLWDLPAYEGMGEHNMLSAAYALTRRCLSLPIYPELTDLEVEYIIDQLLEIV
jgi:dTDP-4-amino-4,6-dideoxygalactose transaminase